MCPCATTGLHLLSVLVCVCLRAPSVLPFPRTQSGAWERYGRPVIMGDWCTTDHPSMPQPHHLLEVHTRGPAQPQPSAAQRSPAQRRGHRCQGWSPTDPAGGGNSHGEPTSPVESPAHRGGEAAFQSRAEQSRRRPFKNKPTSHWEFSKRGTVFCFTGGVLFGVLLCYHINLRVERSRRCLRAHCTSEHT